MVDEQEQQSVDSASDERTVNNVEDAVRHAYRVLTDEEKTLMVEIKYLGQELLNKINSIGTSRELSIARTKAEEAVMWAVKHITA
jgi:thiamine biosynthesis protein ThiC